MTEDQKKYWFNVSTGEVETGPKSAWNKRLGPFATREEAANALATYRERNKKWDDADQEDRDWGYDD